MRRYERERFDATTLGARCGECPLRDRKPVLPRYATAGSAKLILLGESPGAEDNYFGSPFMGRAGEYLDQALERGGLSRDECHVTNAVLCAPTGQTKPADFKRAIACCAPRLERELAGTQCTTVLAMGDRAVKSVLGPSASVTHWAGYPKQGVVTDPHRSDYTRYTVLPTWHPSFAAFYKPSLRTTFETCIQRAWRLANDKFPSWQWPDFHLHVSETTLQALLEMHAQGRPVALDVENIPGADTLTALGLSNGALTVSVPLDRYEAVAGTVVGDLRRDYGPLGERIFQAISAILADPALVKIAHNGAHDLAIFHVKGMVVRNYAFDTLLAHAVVAQQQPHDLGYVAMSYFAAPRWKSDWGVLDGDAKSLGDKWVKRDPLQLRTYNARDVFMTRLLYEELKMQLEAFPQGVSLFKNLMQLQSTGMKMKAHGFHIDQISREKHIKRIEPLVYKHRANVIEIANKLGIESFNPRSNKQLKELFFGKLNCKPVKYSSATEEPSLDEEALTKYRTHPDRKVQFVCEHILQFRTQDKLLGTYLRNLPVESDGKLRSTPNVHGAITGRWSFKDPSIQVIPKPRYGVDNEGKKIVTVPGMRDMFCASPGRVLVQADYSQLELRIVAILSNAPKILSWYREGRDVHTQNAQAIFGKDFTPSQRTLAKNYIFGKIYGGSDETIFELLRKDFPSLTLTQVQFISESWQREHPEIFDYQASVIAQAKVNGYVSAPLSGRRRYFFDKVSPTEASNFAIQATGADIINRAVLSIDSELNWTRGAILAQVHDELVLEHEEPLTAFRLLKKHMEAPVELNGASWTFPIEVGIGPNWSNLTKVTDENALASLSM